MGEPRRGPAEPKRQMHLRLIDQPTAVDAGICRPQERRARAAGAPADQHADGAWRAGAADAATVARRAKGRLRRRVDVDLDDLVHAAMVAGAAGVRSPDKRRKWAE